MKWLADKVCSTLIFAHVRAASLDSITTDVNCHPFSYKNLMWMHNGGIAQFNKIRRRAVAGLSEQIFNNILGTTDSETAFAMFLEELLTNDTTGLGFDRDFTWQELQSAMLRVIRTINRMSKEAGITDISLLNFAVTDGRSIIASRYINRHNGVPASMYFSSGTQWVEDPRQKGFYKMLQKDRREHAIIIASERLSNTEEDWVEVPVNHFIAVTPSMNVFIMPIEADI